MKSISKTILLGHVGVVDTKTLENGKVVCNFSVATNSSWKNKETGVKSEFTEWHNCTAWDKLGELCGQMLKKGSAVYIEGHNKTTKSEQNGTTYYNTSIIVDEFSALDGKDETGAE
jgi:single-strand DNA-binding protein